MSDTQTAETTAEVEQIEAGGMARIVAAATLAELRAVEQELIAGKRSALAAVNQRLASLPVEARKEVGRSINEARSRLAAAVADMAGTLEAAERETQLESERLDLTEVIGRVSRGHHHLVTQARDDLEDLFVGMGYRVAEGPEVETDWYNF